MKEGSPRILVIDGQGGRIGRLLIEALLQRLPDARITAVGTNSAATAGMLKGGRLPGCHRRKCRSSGLPAGGHHRRSGRYCHRRRPAGRDHAGYGGGSGRQPGTEGAHPHRAVRHPGGRSTVPFSLRADPEGGRAHLRRGGGLTQAVALFSVAPLPVLTGEGRCCILVVLSAEADRPGIHNPAGAEAPLLYGIGLVRWFSLRGPAL